jgi:N6-L-threonylcarbamoyladenine synthase
MAKGGIGYADLDAAAATTGPGLIGGLIVGASFAKGVALAHHLPFIAINHLEAHALTVRMPGLMPGRAPAFPYLLLLLSGGHCQCVLVEGLGCYRRLGSTLDDAVGEAFDKTAKLLGLPYPGGPLLDRHAKEGNPKAFSFPVTRMPGLNYSFSGIKTAVLYFLRDRLAENPNFITENLADLCASIQYTLVEMLLIKLKLAMKEYGITEVAIAGGVSANSGLRAALSALSQRKGWTLYVPEFEYCTDNAAMIAMAAHFKYLRGEFVGYDIAPLAKMKF